MVVYQTAFFVKSCHSIHPVSSPVFVYLQQFVDEKRSKKILEQARAQQEELEDEHVGASTTKTKKSEKKKQRKVYLTSDKTSRQQVDSDEEEEDVGDEGESFDAEQYYEHFVSEKFFICENK